MHRHWIETVFIGLLLVRYCLVIGWILVSRRIAIGFYWIAIVFPMDCYWVSLVFPSNPYRYCIAMGIAIGSLLVRYCAIVGVLWFYCFASCFNWIIVALPLALKWSRILFPSHLHCY